jgi:hypothetical protein
VRVVQETLKTVEYDVETCPVCGGDAGTQVIKKGFDFAPMYIAADRVMEDGKQQAVMLVAHGSSPLTIDTQFSIIPCCGKVKYFKEIGLLLTFKHFEGECAGLKCNTVAGMLESKLIFAALKYYLLLI